MYYLFGDHAPQDIALDAVVDAPAEGEEEAAAVREDEVARGPLFVVSDQFQSDEALVHVDHFGHVTQPFLAVEELEQLTHLEPLLAGGAQGAREVRRRGGLPVYRCNGKNNSVLVG